MDAKVLAAVALSVVVAWPVSARTVRCRDGAPPSLVAGLPECDTGAACDGACTFAFVGCPQCRSCACLAVLCVPGSVEEVSVPAGRRLIILGCRTRGVPKLVLRCSARPCVASAGLSR